MFSLANIKHRLLQSHGVERPKEAPSRVASTKSYQFGNFTLEIPSDHKIEEIHKVDLLYDRNIGMIIEEIARKYPYDTMTDIGANVGLFSVVLGCAVRAEGRVISAEPVPINALRAKANFELNRLSNVQLVNAAVGSAEGTIQLNLANDLAYPSLIQVAESRGSGESIEVQLRTLDSLWYEIGSPEVRFVKIDVEGAELDVLRGAVQMLRCTQPVFLLESNSANSLEDLRKELEPIGYRFIQPPGFVMHNYLAMPPLDIPHKSQLQDVNVASSVI